MSSFYEYMAKGSKEGNANLQPQEAVAQDQDTVIGDAMCHASQMIYDVASDIAACINEDNQAAIPMERLREAERALCYMEGVVFGLAMDDKAMMWYMTELARCIASIEQSKEQGFQTQIYVPPVKPCDLFGFDEVHCRNNPVTFLRISLKRPNEEYVKAMKEDLAKDPNSKYLFEKGILDPFKFPGAPVPPPIDADSPPETAKDSGADKKTEDDSQSVLNLRNLFRHNKIDKSQYIGGLATLVATGLISKSEFTRLKTAAN